MIKGLTKYISKRGNPKQRKHSIMHYMQILSPKKSSGQPWQGEREEGLPGSVPKMDRGLFNNSVCVTCLTAACWSLRSSLTCRRAERGSTGHRGAQQSQNSLWTPKRLGQSEWATEREKDRIAKGMRVLAGISGKLKNSLLLKSSL